MVGGGIGDQDGGGRADDVEEANDTGPAEGRDIDGDGPSDSEQLDREAEPRKTDTDGDDLTDGDEAKRNTDPLNFFSPR